MTNSDGPAIQGPVNGRKVSVRPEPRPRSRWRLIIMVGIPVVLLAAIVAVGQQGGAPVQPAVDRARTGSFAHNRSGAQSASAKYASSLGSEAMFNESTRHALLKGITDPSRLAKLQAAFDADYTAAFNRRLGLDAHGRPPEGAVFVSRTLPAGTTVKAYSSSQTTVDVWCSGLLSRTGKNPIHSTTNWFTVTLKLRWTAGDWKLAEVTQHDGPTPEHGEFGQAPKL